MTRGFKGAAAACLGCLWIATTAVADYAKLDVDKVHSEIGFTAATLLFEVNGKFKEFQVELDGNPSAPEQAKVRMTIRTASVFTDNERRDEHLRSDDFFHAKKYPTITFTSSKVTRTPEGIRITGTLSMHGHEKPLTIPFRVTRGKNGAGRDTVAYKGSITIDRTAFGIGANSVAAQISLKNKVRLDLLVVMFP